MNKHIGSSFDAFMIENNMFTEDQAYDFLLEHADQIIGDPLITVEDLCSVNVLRNVINGLRSKQLDFYGWVRTNWEELEYEYGCTKMLVRNNWSYSLTYRAVLFALQEHTAIKYYEEIPEDEKSLDRILAKQMRLARRNINDEISTLEQQIQDRREKLEKIEEVSRVLAELGI